MSKKPEEKDKHNTEGSENTEPVKDAETAKETMPENETEKESDPKDETKKEAKSESSAEKETVPEDKADKETAPEDKADKKAAPEEDSDKEASPEGDSGKEGNKESEKDLYSDEVYKEPDTSDDDMVYLDISGKEVTIASPDSETGTGKSRKIAINIDTEAAVAWLLTVICASVFVSLTFNKNVWLDEAFTASLVRTDMAGVISRSMADTLPPLYNIILKLVTDVFGYTIPVMKLTSTVPMILTMILGATVVRKRFGAITSYIFILAVTVMPNMMFFGVEIRMYSLGFLFATASGIFAYEVISEPCKRNWILFTLSAVLAGYSHHFAFVTAGFIYLYVLIYACIEQKRFTNERDRELHPIILSSFAKCLGATFILYLPCMLVTVRQLKSVSGYFSMPDVTLPVFIKYCRYPFTVGFTPLSIILLAVNLVLFIRLIFRREKSKGDWFSLYCFIVFYGVLIFGTIISKMMTANIFVDRYLFFSLGLIWLFYAKEAGSLKKPFVYCIIMLELITGIYSYTQAFTDEYAPGADEMIKWLDENVSEGDSLYTVEDYEELAWCLPFYNSRLTNYETLDEAVKEAGGQNVWVAVLNGSNEDAYTAEADEKGYSAEYEGVFRFDRYIFRMYRLVK